MTYKQLIESMDLIARNVGNQETKVQKKLLKIYNKLKVYYDRYEELRNDIRLDYASVDEKNNVVLNDKSDYVFTKDQLKEMQKALRDLINSEFIFEKIEVLNPLGLEDHVYLKDFVNGVSFKLEDDEEDSI
jgi:RecA/RadA recombinase